MTEVEPAQRRAMRSGMRLCALLAALVLAAACSKDSSSTTASGPAASAHAPATSTYGRVSDGPTLTPAEVLANLDAHDGKVVRIAGTVAAVCPMRGCWMDIAGAGGETIRIKVKDGEVVFPQSAKGKKVVAEGILVKIPADPAADSTASCGGGETHPEGEHHNCARPAGARARLDGFGAVITEAS